MNEIFSSKPQQISEAIIKISAEIFGKPHNANVLVIGDQKVIIDISENLKTNDFGKYFLVNDIELSNNFNFLKTENDEIKFLEKFGHFDIFLVGCKRGIKIITGELTKKVLNTRKQRPILMIDGGLPGNVDQEVLKISNVFLYDLNDLEQFFSNWRKDKSLNDKKNYFSDDIIRNESLISFFKELNLSNYQKKKFFSYLKDFLLKNNDDDFKKKFFNFLQSFRE